jgi:hypothetical protein
VNEELFESLLAESEGVLLDFKAEQYKFSKATPEERSELAKDILGFANALRRADSFILIGVKDKSPEPPELLGIDPNDQLHDHSVQQFMTGMTNRQVKFTCRAFTHQGKQFGILQIDQHQDRPLFLTKDFGKLKKGIAYLRRGSSTDLHLVATLDEIAAMGRTAGQSPAEVTVEFVDIDTREGVGNELDLDTVVLVPPPNTLPDFTFRRPAAVIAGDPLSQLAASLTAQPWTHIENREYWRELADYLLRRSASIVLELVVKNTGSAEAANVRVEIETVHEQGLILSLFSDLPKPPKQTKLDVPFHRGRDLIHEISRPPGFTTVSLDGPVWRTVIECGSLQPGRKVYSQRLCFARTSSAVTALKGTVYASNLPRPQSFELKINLNVTPRRITLDEMVAMPDAKMWLDEIDG